MYIVYSENIDSRWPTEAQAIDRMETLNYHTSGKKYHIKEETPNPTTPCPCCGMTIHDD